METHRHNGQSFSLRRARLNRGLSLRQAASEIGIAQQTLKNLESGISVHPASAKKAADYFEVKVTDLLDAEQSESSRAAA